MRKSEAQTPKTEKKTSEKRHSNIPIFIPHLGCPNQCVFCNQHTISGHDTFSAERVIPEIEAVLATLPTDCEKEIAFFGGSFTGIDRALMVRLLDIAEGYVRSGHVAGIRMSTRPDYINPEIVDILSRYSVKTVELGIQSTDDVVLRLSKRGHTAEESESACRLVKAAGWNLIGQMMIGLPGSTMASEVKTAEDICNFHADGARIYPTVVFYETELCHMAELGQYTPLNENDAVERTKEALKVLERRGVPCIRIGLCASENLMSKETVYGGANQSALGELAVGELYYEKEDALLRQKWTEDMRPLRVVFAVAPGCISKAVGQKRKNILRLQKKYSLIEIKTVEKKEILGYNIELE